MLIYLFDFGLLIFLDFGSFLMSSLTKLLISDGPSEVEEGELCSDTESALNKLNKSEYGCKELNASASERPAQEDQSKSGNMQTVVTATSSDGKSASGPSALCPKRKRERRRRRNRRSNVDSEQQPNAAEEGCAGAEPAAKRPCLGEYGSDEELDRSSTDGEEVVLAEQVLGPRCAEEDAPPVLAVDRSDPLGLSSCLGEAQMAAADVESVSALLPSTSAGEQQEEEKQHEGPVEVIKERYTLVGTSIEQQLLVA